ncbi:MAG TPA: mechanosensitive ion channel domain-containing protein [Gemmatimonadaceae bacterium]|nr:mechanosensitive ion channel domain-containing protein [Gemmatimonadaceae bacterium]
MKPPFHRRQRSPRVAGLRALALSLAIMLPIAASPFGPASASAQATAAAPNTSTSAQATPGDSATLTLSNVRVFVFRVPLGALSPEARAAGARTRIERIAERGLSDSVMAERRPEGFVLLAGSEPVLTVTPGDVDVAAGETLDGLARQTATRLRTVLAAEIQQRSLIHILRGILFALVATGIFVFTIRALRLGRRFALRKIPDPYDPRLPRLRLAGFTILTANQLLIFVQRAVDLLAWGTGVFVAYLWLAYVLTRFAFSRPWGEILGEYLVRTVGGLALGAIIAIPDLFTVFLIFIVTRWIARLVTAFFDAVERDEVHVPWVHSETANPTRRIITAMLWLFAIVVAYPYLPGSQTDAFKGVSVFAGLLITLGSTGIVNQAMSGLVLMYSRALKPGDYVRIGETEGVVTTLGMLSTKIRTNKREEVTVPNAVVVTANIKNYSRLSTDEGVILHTPVTIGYDTPWRQVHGLLLLAAERTEGLRRTPQPFVQQTALSDFYVEYQLNAHLEKPERRLAVMSELHGHIIDCFNEYGVQITSPNYVADPKQRKVVPPDRWYEAPARASVPVGPSLQVPNETTATQK